MAKRAFDLIAFDGDDTLWHNERSYRMGRDRFYRLLASAGVVLSEDEIDAHVNRVELQNIPYYGYGVSNFILSLIESALALAGGRVAGGEIQGLIDLAKQMLTRRDRAVRGRARGGHDACRGVPAGAHHQGRPAAPDIQGRSVRVARSLSVRRSRQQQDRGRVRLDPGTAGRRRPAFPDGRQLRQVGHPAGPRARGMGRPRPGHSELVARGRAKCPTRRGRAASSLRTPHGPGGSACNGLENGGPWI